MHLLEPASNSGRDGERPAKQNTTYSPASQASDRTESSFFPRLCEQKRHVQRDQHPHAGGGSCAGRAGLQVPLLAIKCLVWSKWAGSRLLVTAKAARGGCRKDTANVSASGTADDPVGFAAQWGQYCGYDGEDIEWDDTSCKLGHLHLCKLSKALARERFKETDCSNCFCLLATHHVPASPSTRLQHRLVDDIRILHLGQTGRQARTTEPDSAIQSAGQAQRAIRSRRRGGEEVEYQQGREADAVAATP